MDKILLQVSKFGDIANILPLAKKLSESGKIGIMVCEEYASILDGVSYVEKIVFTGKPWEIEKAFNEAKKLCENVSVVQVNGPLDAIKKLAYQPAGQEGAVTDSFSRESWKLAGHQKEWGKLPLIFDRRDSAREMALLESLGLMARGRKKKLILLSNGSASSPFPYRNLLKEIVTLKYGTTCRVIDLNEVKAERIYDLLAIYELAYCLITVDTAHLHLAAAIPRLPVMALVQDKPIYWNGSAWRPQHHFFCRYREFPWRALELFTAIDNIGVKTDSKVLQVYYGSVRPNNGVRYFPIQYGACRRDASNVLNDEYHFPMLQDAIRMAAQVADKDTQIILTREDVTVTESALKQSGASYAFRCNRSKQGLDTFAPMVDMFSAPLDFWVRIFPKIPDVVFGIDAHWSRILCEIFKSEGAIEIDGIYRLD